jgi:hypothetical protein
VVGLVSVIFKPETKLGWGIVRGYCPGFSIRAISYSIFRGYIRMAENTLGTISDVQWIESQRGVMQLEIDT